MIESRSLGLLVGAAALCLAPFSVADGQREGSNPEAIAGQSFYQGKSEGWFWYQEYPDPEPAAKELPAVPSPPKTPEPEKISKVEREEIKPFTSAWIRIELPKFRDRAMDDPSPQNVRAYYYLQRMAMDKATKFSEMSTNVIMRDPFLDEDSRRPQATYAANAMAREALDKRNEVVKEIGTKSGLFFFFKSNCILCTEQAGVLVALQNATGVPIIPISLDGKPLDNQLFPDYKTDSGQAEQLGIYQTPALALAIPPARTEVVGFGAVTLDTLLNRIVVVARDAKVISTKQYQSTQPVFDNGLLISKELQSVDKAVLEDPAQLSQYLQDHLRETVRMNNDEISP
ncbi:conjugal transfer protein TraF [Pseudomonas brenneri]|uniref:conjugal transfer protein TraF n=1 Tax=Pseudomonas brenneri TaxID=129817 RepID=UPI003BA18A48